MGWASRKKRKLETRPTAHGLVVPFMVDATLDPIDFKVVDADHVAQCAADRLCGICGGVIPPGPLVFIGPDDQRRCFADPWMHAACARVALVQCPFLTGRSDWRDGGKNSELLKTYAHNMAAFVASEGRAHQDALGAWHFQAWGTFKKLDN
jgi:hypothetical protein